MHLTSPFTLSLAAVRDLRERELRAFPAPVGPLSALCPGRGAVFPSPSVLEAMIEALCRVTVPCSIV